MYYLLTFYVLFVQEYGSPPAVPQARGPVYPPGTPVHQDYGNTPLGPVAESPARADHLYPPSYETPLHEPTYDDAYQVLAFHTLVLKKEMYSYQSVGHTGRSILDRYGEPPDRARGLYFGKSPPPGKNIRADVIWGKKRGTKKEERGNKIRKWEIKRENGK